MSDALAARDSLGGGLRYGLLGLPLAFCALPLYVLVPNLYATQFGIPLAALGAVLLATRVFDALLDPWIGRWCDRLLARGSQRLWRAMAVAALALAGSFFALFEPVTGYGGALWWLAVTLLLTSVAFSVLTVAYQSWGSALGGDALQRSRVVAWREGFGLLGVLLAAVVPAVWGVGAMTALMLIALALGVWALHAAPRPPVGATQHRVVQSPGASAWAPWRNAPFVRLVTVFALNGIAAAVPATLVLFFIQDRVQATGPAQGYFLGLYFLCGALSMPLWLRVVQRLGLVRTWFIGMALSVVTFLGCAGVGAGDVWLYALVCALSGAALGSDLALPSALLTGIVQRSGSTPLQGLYFGWWNLVSKLNLSLAAGIALPLLNLLGYAPGAREPQALQALTVVYCLVPCAFKLLAAAALYFHFIAKPGVHHHAT